MNLPESIILGIIEGFTEFLPVSSTGHLILTSTILNLKQADFLKSFEIAIQLGAVLSIVFLYWKSFLAERETLKRVFAAFLPTAIGGIIFYKIFKNVLLENSNIVLWALFSGGVFLIIFELFYREKENSIERISGLPYSKSFFIGAFQIIAMIPGVSRAAATIIGGLALGLKRKTIVEFSFLLAVPTMLGATVFDLVQNVNKFSFEQINFLVIGFIISFITAILSVKFLLRFIKNHNFVIFGFYRIILAFLFWLII